MDKYSVHKIKFHHSYEPVGEYDYSQSPTTKVRGLVR